MPDEDSDGDGLRYECSKLDTPPTETTIGSFLDIREINYFPNLKPVATEQTLVPSPRETGDWMLNRKIAFEIFQEFGTPKIDLFASSKNKQADFYYRKPSAITKPGQGCLGDDAFRAKWFENELLYANPPWVRVAQPAG